MVGFGGAAKLDTMTRTSTPHSTLHEGPRLPVPESAIASGIVERPEPIQRRYIFTDTVSDSHRKRRGIKSAPSQSSSLRATGPIRFLSGSNSPRVQCQQAIAQEAKLMRRMMKLIAAGRTKEARVCQRAYLQSLAAKIVAVLQVCDDLRRMHRIVPDGLEIISIAKQVDPSHDPGEKITIWRKDKGQGRCRIIHDFEIINRARCRYPKSARTPPSL